MKQKLRPLEVFMNLLFFLCGLIAVVFVLFISIYLIISGLPAIKEIGLVDFLFGTKWASTAAEPSFGILPFILTSIYGTAGAIVLGVPVGFMTAVFLAKIAPPKLAAAVRTAVDLLAGIPSVVYGLIGMIVLVPAVMKALELKSGSCLLSAHVVSNFLKLRLKTRSAVISDDGHSIIFCHIKELFATVFNSSRSAVFTQEGIYSLLSRDKLLALSHFELITCNFGICCRGQCFFSGTIHRTVVDARGIAEVSLMRTGI